VTLQLSDGTAEPWRPESTRAGPDGALYALVKPQLPGGPYEAKFTQHAQSSLAPLLVDMKGDEGPSAGAEEREVAVRIDGRLHAIVPKKASFG
jgi:hypothetical protein